MHKEWVKSLSLSLCVLHQRASRHSRPTPATSYRSLCDLLLPTPLQPSLHLLLIGGDWCHLSILHRRRGTGWRHAWTSCEEAAGWGRLPFYPPRTTPQCWANVATPHHRVSLGSSCARIVARNGSQCAPESVAHRMVVRSGDAPGCFCSASMWKHAGTSP